MCNPNQTLDHYTQSYVFYDLGTARRMPKAWLYIRNLGVWQLLASACSRSFLTCIPPVTTYLKVQVSIDDVGGKLAQWGVLIIKNA